MLARAARAAPGDLEVETELVRPEPGNLGRSVARTHDRRDGLPSLLDRTGMLSRRMRSPTRLTARLVTSPIARMRGSPVRAPPSTTTPLSQASPAARASSSRDGAHADHGDVAGDLAH
jgi:hypothetical protein